MSKDASESDLDLGYLVTGVLEHHPITGDWIIRVVQENGEQGYFPLEDVLNKYAGEEVRLTVATTATIRHLTALVGDVQVVDGVPASKIGSS